MFSILFVVVLIIPGICQAEYKDLSCKMPFDDFLNEMKDKALKRGVSLETVTNVLLNTKHLSEVIRLDRNQTAFRMSFTQFSDKAVNEYRLIHGKKKLEKHRTMFDSIWKKSFF